MAAPFQTLYRPILHPLARSSKGKLSRGVLATALALSLLPTWQVPAQEPLAQEPLAAEPLAAEPLPKPAQEEQQVVIIAAEHGDGAKSQMNPFQSNKKQELAKRAAQPKLWLGVVLKTIEGDLASYLDIDGGVLVESVFPESPAAAAGLKKGDVLLTFADQELAAPGDVMAIMRTVDTHNTQELQPLSVKALRKGEELLLTITPTPRPGKTLTLDVTALVTREEDAEVADEDVSGAEESESSGAFSFAFSTDQPFAEIQTLIEKIQLMNKGIEKEVQIFQLGNPTIRVSPSGELAELSASQESEVVEPLLKKGNRVQSFSAGGLKLDAALDQQEVKQMVERYQSMANEMSRKARMSAEEMRTRALQMAGEAKAQAAGSAQAAASARAHAENATAGNPEVALLKQQVEELRAEVKQLRQKLEQK